MTRAMLLSELLPDIAGIPADLAITGLVQDSRALKPGDAFVAIGGFGAHGLRFVDQARSARRRRDPVRTAGTGSHACARRCDRGARACARAWARWPTASTASRRAR